MRQQAAARDHLAAVRRASPENWPDTFRRMAIYDFAGDMNIGFVLAYFRSFAIPATAAALLGTGEITERPGKRATDTGIVVYEIIAHGVDSEPGRAMVQLLRRVHTGVPGTDADFRYVLISLLIAPLRWIDAHGWRAVEPAEREAAYRFFAELGRRIGLAEVPGSYDAAAAFFDAYEAEQVSASAAGAALTTSAMPSFTGKLPRAVRRWDRAILGALIGDVRVVRALGLPVPGRGVRTLLGLVVRLRAVRSSARAPATEAGFRSGAARSAYPHGYTLDRVGPYAR